MLYQIEKNKKINLISQKTISEKDVQELVGENLEQLFGYKFVSFEFKIDNKFIDILAFDFENNSPVLIELKKENDKGLFDQGMEYFNLLSDRKNDFLIEFHKVLKIPADPKKIDWSASKVVFIGKNFTQRQKRAVDFKGLPIELWDYDWYENNLFKLEYINLNKKSKLEIAGIGNKTIEKVKRNFKEYDEEYHLNKIDAELVKIYEQYKDELLKMEGIRKSPTVNYINFIYKNVGVATFYFKKETLTINFGRNTWNLKLPKDLKIKDESKQRPNYNQQYRIDIKNDENFLEILNIFKQIYKKIDSL